MKKYSIWLIAIFSFVMGSIVIIFFYSAKNKKITNIKPNELFQEYICSPIPDGVTNISYKGNISFSSTNIIIKFNVTNKSVFDDIVRLGHLTPDKKILKNESLESKSHIITYGKVYNGYESIQISFDTLNLSGQAYYAGG